MISKKKTIGLVAGVVSVALAMAGCSAGTSGGGATSSSDANKPFHMVAMVALSGAQAAAGGIPAQHGIKSEVKLINSVGGGINGRQLEVDFVDTASDPTQATNNLQSYLSSHDRPDAVFEGVYSSDALPVSPLLTQQKFFAVCSCLSPAVTDPTKFPYSFTTSYYATMASSALAAEMQKKGYKKVAYAAADNESGHAQVAAFTTAATALNIKVISAFYPVDAVDATPALDSLRSQSPDALVVYAPPTSAAAVILQSRTKLGWTIPTYGDAPFSATAFALQTTKADWKNLLLQSQAYDVVGTPMATSKGYKAFVAQFKKDWGEKALNDSGFASTVSPPSAFLLVKAAFEATKATDGPSAAKALEKVGAEKTIPKDIADLWVGPEPWGLSPTNHAPVWGPDDFSYIPVSPIIDGMYDTSKS
jgi:branched-chain amino acid transport system substrate-binding protein